MLDDLKIKMDFDLGEIEKGTKFMGMNLKSAQTHAKKIELALSQVTNKLNAIAKMSEDGLSRIFIAGAEGIEAIDLEDLQRRTQAAADKLAAMWDEQNAALDTTIERVLFLNDSMTQKAAVEAIRRMSGGFDEVAESARIARNEITALTDQSQQAQARITVRDPQAQPAPPPATTALSVLGGGGMAAAAAVGARAMTTINRAMTETVKTVKTVQHNFDVFRASRLAPEVDPRFNLIARSIDGIGITAAGTVETLRATGDAIISGVGDTALSGAKSVGLLGQAFDRVSSTVSKFSWFLKSSSASLQLLQVVFFPLAGMLQKYINLIDKSTGKTSFFDNVMRTLSAIIDRVIGSLQGGGPVLQMLGRLLEPVSRMFSDLGDSTASLGGRVDVLAGSVSNISGNMGVLSSMASGLGYILTGTFVGAAGPAAQFGDAMYYSLLPARLLFREYEGGRRIVNAFMISMSALSSPFRVVTGYLANNRAQWNMLSEAVKNKSTATRIAAKSLFVLHRTIVPIAGVVAGTVTAVTRLGRGIAGLASPVTSMVRNTGSAIKNLLMFGKTSVDAGSAAANLASSVGTVGAAMIGTRNAAKAASKSITNIFIGKPKDLLKGLLSSKLALAGLAAGAVAWGGANAVATETAEVKFATLLGSMEQSKALLGEITQFSAMTPFANEDLRESTGLLLAAQVPANAITDRLTMLGDIAAGTSQPIGEMTSIFTKVAQTGKLQLDSINQFAERGVPLYSALQDTLGVSRDQLMDMVSKGQLGFNDLDTALQSLTASGGMFAGGMAAQSQTFAGLWSTLKDNVGIVLEGIMGAFMGGLKNMMNFAIPVIQNIGAIISSLAPVFNAFVGFVMGYSRAMFALLEAGFGVILNVVSSVFAFLGFSGEATFNGFIAGAVKFFTIAQYTFENFPLFAAIAFTKAQLFFTTLVNDIAYFFTDSMPAYMSWFGDNWSLLFLDAVAAVATAFSNITKNISNAWDAIWNYLTGKSDTLSFDWTPISEGFRKTIADLPDISERALSDVEQQLQRDLSGMTATFNEGRDKAVADALADLAKTEPVVELQGTVAKVDAVVEDTGQADEDKKADTGSDAGRQVERKAISTRSGEGSSVLAQLLSRLPDETKKQSKHMATAAEKLTDIERGLRNGNPIRSQAWGAT